MIANINPESLQKTKERMIAEVEQQIKGCIGMILTDVNERRFEDFGVTLKECLEWLEKQGEQKPYGQRKKCSDCQFNYTGECKGSCQMKIDEQKSANKAEPKFHEGEWIVSNNGTYTYQVREVKRGVYVLWDSLSDRIFIIGIEEAERSGRLWTIEDVKDGDVLVSKGKGGQEVGIIKEFIGKYGGYNKCFETYCYSDLDGTFRIGEYMGGISIHPATKEQRGLLFQKMKEAGYEWDSENKELKKVEPKMLDADEVIEWLRNRSTSLFGPRLCKTMNIIKQFKKDFSL